MKGIRGHQSFEDDLSISSHHASHNLYIVTGGSFHDWRNLPINGEYNTGLLLGEFDASLVKRWDWDRKQGGGAGKMLMPTRDLRGLIDGSEQGKKDGEIGLKTDAKE